MVKVYGSSDDLICIGGDWEDELTFRGGDDDEHAVLALSDGTLLRVYYDGCWRFSQLVAGRIPFSKVEAEGEDKEGSRPSGEPWYSDVLTFGGDIKWIAHAEGQSFATKKPLRSTR